MTLEDDLRTQIIKQFAADVILLQDKSGKQYYACPTCKRQALMNSGKWLSCDQVLKWDHIRAEEQEQVEIKKATLTFEVPGTFSKSDCRRCPLSYIARIDGTSSYECPLNMRNNCPLEIE